MAKDIATGVDSIVKRMTARQQEQESMQWRDLRNKIDSLLLSTNVLKTDDARRACLELDTMSPEARETFITHRWGPNYLIRVSPLLHQLQVLENHINKAQSTNEFQSVGKPELLDESSEDEEAKLFGELDDLEENDIGA